MLDLSQDVHEFVELYNSSNQDVSVAGWRLDSAIQFTFPTGASIPAGGFLVVAANPPRLAAVTQYSISASSIAGPYAGRLSNGEGGELVRLRDASNLVRDAVNYSSAFPWPTSADALGASERWTGINRVLHQYRGRSLERISAAHPGNDPANWAASVFPGDPTPGRVNSAAARDPLPVVLSHRIYQTSNGAFPITSNQPARIEAVFSSSQSLSEVRIEYWADDVNKANEPRTTVSMTGIGPVFSGEIPGLPSRTIVRYRILAKRTGPRFSADEPVHPRHDDTFPWAGYFVTPVRASAAPAYDLLISTAAATQLGRNLSDNPISGYNPPLGTLPMGRWNDTQPAVIAYGGEIYDAQVRHSGSFYRRDFSRNSYKAEFPSSRKLNGHSTLLILDKGTENAFGHRLFEDSRFPSCRVRPVDLYVNNQARVARLEFEEHDEDLLRRWAEEERIRNPNATGIGTGHLWKSSGLVQDIGPYGPANGTQMKTNQGWTPLQRYEWVYSSKNRDWEGYLPLKEMIDELWAARGSGPGVDIPKLREYLAEKWDLAKLIDYVAYRAWMSAGDDAYHNYFVWKRSDGKWQMVPWDFDGEIGDVPRDIFAGEGGNFFKDSVFKAYREEFKQRLWWLANTHFHPENLQAVGLWHPNLAIYANERQKVINTATFGVFHRPAQPVAITPSAGESVIGASSLRATDYSHSLSPAPSHESTIWEIRSSLGSYRRPVFSVTSSLDRTSLPLPADRLLAGQLYHWRATYLDATGRPSVPSVESAFRFGGNFRRSELISLDAEWSYLENGTNIARTWRDRDFDDSSWLRGRAILGVSTSSPALLPAPVRTALPLGQRIYYLRRKFQIPSDPANAILRLRYLADDGVVFYINGREAMRANVASLYPLNSVPPNAFATRDVGIPGLEQPVDLAATNLVQGENVLAVQVHQSRDASPDVLFAAVLSATLESSAGAFRINELFTAPESGAPPDRATPWIEIINVSGQPASLEGLRITDNPAEPGKFILPASAGAAAPGERRVVGLGIAGPWPHQAALGFSTERGRFWLFGPDGNGGLLELDSISHGLQAPGWSMGRIPEGSGGWSLAVPTPSGVNARARTAPISDVKVNEWMASPQSGPDWIELFNPSLLPADISGGYLSDDPNNRTNSPIPFLSFLPPWSFTRFFADGRADLGPLHCSFRLSASGEAAALFDSRLNMVDQVVFGAQADDVSEGRVPDGADSVRPLQRGGTPGGSNSGDADGDGMPDDWEQLNGLAGWIRDGNLDGDGDGASNFEEFIADTNPRDSRDRLSITAQKSADGLSVLLSWDLRPGKTYEILRSRDIRGGEWEPIQTIGSELSPKRANIMMPIPAGAESAYFRLTLRRG